jgi:hypothetical protein
MLDPGRPLAVIAIKSSSRTPASRSFMVSLMERRMSRLPESENSFEIESPVENPRDDTTFPCIEFAEIGLRFRGSLEVFRPARKMLHVVSSRERL